jgi:hypothetical protein
VLRTDFAFQLAGHRSLVLLVGELSASGRMTGMVDGAMWKGCFSSSYHNRSHTRAAGVTFWTRSTRVYSQACASSTFATRPRPHPTAGFCLEGLQKLVAVHIWVYGLPAFRVLGWMCNRLVGLRASAKC